MEREQCVEEICCYAMQYLSLYALPCGTGTHNEHKHDSRWKVCKERKTDYISACCREEDLDASATAPGDSSDCIPPCLITSGPHQVIEPFAVNVHITSIGSSCVNILFLSSVRKRRKPPNLLVLDFWIRSKKFTYCFSAVGHDGWCVM